MENRGGSLLFKPMKQEGLDKDGPKKIEVLEFLDKSWDGVNAFRPHNLGALFNYINFHPFFIKLHPL